MSKHQLIFTLNVIFSTHLASHLATPPPSERDKWLTASCSPQTLQHQQAAEKGAARKWRFVLSGGCPPEAVPAGALPTDLLFTGHADGRVRVWDACSEVPTLLCTVPHDAGGQTGRLRAVTCTQVQTGHVYHRHMLHSGRERGRDGSKSRRPRLWDFDGYGY